MHVRVAWEIYHHQQKQTAESKSSLGSSGSKETLLRPSGHLFPTSTGPRHDLGGYPPGFLPPPPHIGTLAFLLLNFHLNTNVVINDHIFTFRFYGGSFWTVPSYG